VILKLGCLLNLGPEAPASIYPTGGLWGALALPRRTPRTAAWLRLRWRGSALLVVGAIWVVFPPQGGPTFECSTSHHTVATLPQALPRTECL